MEPIKYYLPDEIFILLSTLGYALTIRVLGVTSKYNIYHTCSWN